MKIISFYSQISAMQLLSDEIIERLKEKIPKIDKIDPSIFGILHLDIVSEDKMYIKQLGK